MKVKFLAIISCLLFFTHTSFSVPMDENKKLIKKPLPCKLRKVLRQIDRANTLTAISEIHIKKGNKARMAQILRKYKKQKRQEAAK